MIKINTITEMTNTIPNTELVTGKLLRKCRNPLN